MPLQSDDLMKFCRILFFGEETLEEVQTNDKECLSDDLIGSYVENRITDPSTLGQIVRHLLHCPECDRKYMRMEALYRYGDPGVGDDLLDGWTSAEDEEADEGCV